MSSKKRTKLSDKKNEKDCIVKKTNNNIYVESELTKNKDEVDSPEEIVKNDELCVSVNERIEMKRLEALKVRQKKTEERLTQKRADMENKATSEDAENPDAASIEKDAEDDFLAKYTDHICEACHKHFPHSYLLNHFDKDVCDSCRDSEEAHRLITRTEAKEEYLLKDCDFDSRSPPLRFLSRKNKQRKFGEMKLYLECQVADRAGEVWGSEEGLEGERVRRVDEREKTRRKKMIKKMSDLRRGTRPGLFVSPPIKHQHEYGQEMHNEEEDMYTKVCTTCKHTMTYEKM